MMGKVGRLDEGDLYRALERAGDGAFVIGADGKVRSWNRAAEKILGYTAPEVVGRLCCDVLLEHEENGSRLCDQGCHVMTLADHGEAIQNFDMRTRTKSGQPLWINISVLEVPNGPSGALVLHFFRDVTAGWEFLRLVHERLATAAGSQAGHVVEPLTRREIEILRLMAAGLRSADMAERLHVSRATVKNHVQNILTKLGVHSRLAAVAYANRRRLL